MRKELKPGDSFSVRIPKDTDPEIIKYLNEERSEKLNKHVISLLFSKIKEEIGPKKDTLKIALPFVLTKAQEDNLKQSITNLLTIMTPQEPEINQPTSTDYSMFDGVLED